MIVCHCYACLFYYVSLIEGDDPNTWVVRGHLEDEELSIIYLKSLYFAFTTFITVGYGDITAYSNCKKTYF